ncbi:hypothetical protein B0H16DRAFT_1470238 [Mycena metata]|uniref:Uncharacterized protein n=1 Tax=Mycena metata TaxID=1033252 RepID=A0AAD7MRR5_9AGAR|nr:hypothetical protein B0H16DRAFT_1470238 [Mycena metata]
MPGIGDDTQPAVNSDVVHSIRDIISDINDLPEYEQMMQILKPLRHLSNSQSAKVSKTRFATHFISATTLSKGLPSGTDHVEGTENGFAERNGEPVATESNK